MASIKIRKILQDSREALTEEITKIYQLETEENFWSIVRKAGLKNVARIHGGNFANKVDSVLGLCIFQETDVIVGDFFELLDEDVPEEWTTIHSVFRLMIEK